MTSAPPLDGRARLLPFAGIGAALLLTLGWAADEFGLAGYDPTRQTISALGSLTTPHAWVWNAMVSLSGVGIVGFAIAMQRRFGGYRGSRLGVALLYVWGLGFVIDGFARLDNARVTDLTTAMQHGSWHQRVHLIESIIDISALTAAPFRWASVFGRVPGWTRMRTFSLTAGVAVVVCDIWFIATGERGVPGIAERVLITAAAVWLAGVCFRLRAD